MKTSIVADLYNESQVAIDARDQKIVKLNAQFQAYKSTEELMESVTPEMLTFFPEINHIVIANGISSTSRYDIYHQKVTLLVVSAKKKLSIQDSERLTTWLGERLHTQKIKLLYE